jgi:hypothetical protein
MYSVIIEGGERKLFKEIPEAFDAATVLCQVHQAPVHVEGHQRIATATPAPDKYPAFTVEFTSPWDQGTLDYARRDLAKRNLGLCTYTLSCANEAEYGGLYCGSCRDILGAPIKTYAAVTR